MSEILDRVVALTFESTAGERVFLLLVDEHSGELVPRLARTRSGDSPGHVNISRTVLGAVMRDKTSMLSTDVPQDRRVDTSESLVPQRSGRSCAPLWTEHEVFGAYVDAPVEKSFSESDLDLFTTVSNYAAVAIEQVSPPASWRRRAAASGSSATTAGGGRTHREAAGRRSRRDARGPGAEVTVLFADLVGFTTWSERMPPSGCVDVERLLYAAMPR